MRDNLAQKEGQIKELLVELDAIHEQLHHTTETTRQQDNQIRTRERELANLKVSLVLPVNKSILIVE